MSMLNPNATNQLGSVTWIYRWCRVEKTRCERWPLNLYHVLVMLTRGRTQKLVLKAREPEGFEAYRLLLRRYEPQTTAHNSDQVGRVAVDAVRR